jgi:hypothetical protein
MASTVRIRLPARIPARAAAPSADTFLTIRETSVLIEIESEWLGAQYVVVDEYR